ncbi:hypothetical protein VTK56DRAFT_725 [Thermocarpiscus australiensis]
MVHGVSRLGTALMISRSDFYYAVTHLCMRLHAVSKVLTSLTWMCGTSPCPSSIATWTCSQSSSMFRNRR